jgi:hypothetical protein
VTDFKRNAAITHVAFKPANPDTGVAPDFPFFVACADSSLYSVTPHASVAIAFLPATAHSLLFTPDGESLVAITQTMNAFFYEASDGSATIRREVKLAGRSPHAFAWVCSPAFKVNLSHFIYLDWRTNACGRHWRRGHSGLGFRA